MGDPAQDQRRTFKPQSGGDGDVSDDASPYEGDQQPFQQYQQQALFTYEGQSYCFANVSPETAALVMNIMGDYNIMNYDPVTSFAVPPIVEFATGVPAVNNNPTNSFASSKYPPRASDYERTEILSKYREKKGRRNFEEKITYGVRQQVAQRMKRARNGKFVSESHKEDDVSTVKNSCLQCGSKSSPQMRTGPEGPKTLCNRCGLRWRNAKRKQM